MEIPLTHLEGNFGGVSFNLCPVKLWWSSINSSQCSCPATQDAPFNSSFCVRKRLTFKGYCQNIANKCSLIKSRAQDLKNLYTYTVPGDICIRFASIDTLLLTGCFHSKIVKINELLCFNCAKLNY